MPFLILFGVAGMLVFLIYRANRPQAAADDAPDLGFSAAPVDVPQSPPVAPQTLSDVRTVVTPALMEEPQAAPEQQSPPFFPAEETLPPRAPELPLAKSLDFLYEFHGAAFGVDPLLLKAIATHESGQNASAVNSADNESIGLMQILCRPDGRGGCANRLNVSGWNEITRTKLFDPDTNIFIGAQILAENISRYGVKRGIATYNRYASRLDPPDGPFGNQPYVDSVLAIYNRLKKG